MKATGSKPDMEKSEMSSGRLATGLYFVATPIGTARDITLRALDILTQVDVLAAEDTRNTRRLLDIHGVKLAGRPLWPYHDHNGAAQRPKLLQALADGKSVAFVSDAGTPLIADPGFTLARAVIAAGYQVFAAPGASALLAALCVAGLPTDRFYFVGFPPNKTLARQRLFVSIAEIPSSLVFYESPKRIKASLSDMAQSLGADRPAAVCRELTKKFEEIRRGGLGDLAQSYEGEATPKGEIVVVIGPPVEREIGEDTIDQALLEALKNHRIKDAAEIVSTELGVSRKLAYTRALKIKTN